MRSNHLMGMKFLFGMMKRCWSGGWAGYMNCMCLLLTDQDPKILESSLQAPSPLSLESPAEKKPEGTGE